MIKQLNSCVLGDPEITKGEKMKLCDHNGQPVLNLIKFCTFSSIKPSNYSQKKSTPKHIKLC